MMSALVFPLALSQFMHLLKVRRVTFDTPEQMEITGLGSGQINTADIGPRLWRGEIELKRMNFVDGARIEALIGALREPSRSFLVYDVRKKHPASDFMGVTIDGYTPQIGALDADNKRFSLAGLPPSYKLTAGDYLSFQYSASPTLYAMHRIVSWETVADGAGVTPLIEVTPHIRPGAIVGANVSLTNAHCNAIIEPGSYEPGSGVGVHSTGISFRFIQILR